LKITDEISIFDSSAGFYSLPHISQDAVVLTNLGKFSPSYFHDSIGSFINEETSISKLS
jgi:hypothetical protein